MNKIKLNIQLFASTNKTDNYQLSQYIGTDKPTYLTDYNSDMRKIDTGIHTAKTNSDQALSDIGTMSDLKTSNQDTIVDAVNEVVDTIGDLDSLETTEKGSVVDSINEVDTLSKQNDSNIDIITNEMGALATLKTESKNNLVSAINEIFDKIYPVGSIYISATDTTPATLFGGTWEQIKDTFLLSAGDTYSAGSTGGEATHTLTVAELAQHRHDGLEWGTTGIPFVYTANTTTTETRAFDLANGGTERYINYDATNKLTSAIQGGGQPHNNMPPYLTVYMWKRTA